MARRPARDKRVYVSAATMRNQDVQETADDILGQLSEGKVPTVKMAASLTFLTLATNLLMFEGLVRRTFTVELTAKGKDHIKKHGPKIYPK